MTDDHHKSLIIAAQNVLMDAMREKYTENMVQYEVAAALPVIAAHPATTLERVAKHPWNFRSASQVVALIDSNRWSATDINDYMAASVALDLIEWFGVSPSHVRSWGRYPDLHPLNEDSKYPEERLSQIIALYKVAENLRDNDKNLASMYIADDKLRELILRPSAPYKREDIIDIITTYNAHDVDRIKAMLNNSATPLHGGVI